MIVIVVIDLQLLIYIPGNSFSLEESKRLATCCWSALEAVLRICQTFEDVLSKVEVSGFVIPDR
jgi:hypothetical protein